MSAHWLESLNEQQRDAVTHGDGPLLVIAGAGSGKTRTLVARLAQLIERGVPPDQILLITFTRRAAAEMLSRAARMTDPAVAKSVWGGTFHATANRLLRIYGSAIGLDSDFTVMDQSDAADMMNLIRSELGLSKSAKRFPRKDTLVKIYSRTVNAQERLSDVLDRYFPWCSHASDGIREVFENYTGRKRDGHVVDYDDLLLLWQVLAAAPGVGQAIAERFDHILVDEYQDTNVIQAGILAAMRRKNRNICVVGDDAQSIYSFRAATVRNILDFPTHYAEARVVKLERNYRSTTTILDASNAVMSHARERYTKELWSDRQSDIRPVLHSCHDEPDQCAQVCDRVLAHLEQGIPLMRQAVLFRTGHHSDQLEVELAKRKIPFHKFGGLKFIEAAHVKDMLAFLRILENPFDEISWFRVLLLMDGVGPRSAQRVIDELQTVVQRSDSDARERSVREDSAGEDGAGEDSARADSPRESRARKDGASKSSSGGEPVRSPMVRLLLDPPQLPPGARRQFESLRQTLADCLGIALESVNEQDIVENIEENKGQTSEEAGEETGDAPKDVAELPLASQIDRLRQFYEPIFEQRYDNAPMRLRDLDQLHHIAAGYSSRSKFVTDLTLDPPESTSDLAQPPYLEEDYLILSTIHSAKGCEWDVVHIIHAADGMIPSDMAVGDDDGGEEERRLLYVAMTRA